MSLHHDANEKTLAIARIVIFSTWFVWFFTDNSYLLANVDNSLFHKHGVMKVLSDNFFLSMEPSVVLVLKMIIMYCLICVILGGPAARWHMLVALVLITFYMGYIRGFGGHANHRELTLLYCSYAMLMLPCFDAFSLNQENVGLNIKLYQASMFVIGLIVVIQYSFIGIARPALGTPHSFHPDVMFGLILNRTIRPNNFGNEFGLLLVDYPILKYITAVMLPFSTFLEIISPIILFSKKNLRLVIVLLLMSFHLGIFLLMNILFVENIILLLLFVNYTSSIDLLEKKSRKLYSTIREKMILFD